MALILNTNLAALNTTRQLQNTQRLQDTTLQQLSTGLRINSAKDDAAGLYVAEGNTKDLRGLNMATRNASDAISLAQTAEGALAQIQENLQRINELAIQSANGTYSDAARTGIQKEVDQLTQEITRITETAEFNGQKLLNRESRAVDMQIGFRHEQGARVAAGLDHGLYGVASQGQAPADIDPDAVTFGVEGTFFSVDPADRAQGFTNDPAVIAEFYQAIGFKAVNPWEIEEEFANSVASALNGALGAGADFQAALNSQPSPFSFNVEGMAVEIRHTGGTISSMVGTLTAGSEKTFINLGIGPIAPPGAPAPAGSLANQLNSAGFPVNSAAITPARLSATQVHFAPSNSTVGIADTTGFANGARIPGALSNPNSVAISPAFPDGIPAEVVAQVQGSLNAVLQGGLNGQKALNISTQADAQKAIEITRTALNDISEFRATFGAMMNRFESVISGNQIYSENISATRSRIRDTDFAATTAQLSKQQVLQQAGIASLTQANASPQAVLSLLN